MSQFLKYIKENTLKHINFQTNRQYGVTLFDLLIALSIAIIVLSVGVPSFTNAMAKAESRHVSHTSHRMLAAARETAMDLDRKVKFCGINQELKCSKTSFSQLAIFVDFNENHALDDDDTLILVRDVNYSGQTKLSASFGRTYIQFNKDGSASQAGSLIYCHPNKPQFSSRITVSMPGRAYKGRDLNGDGIVELSSGKPITCTT